MRKRWAWSVALMLSCIVGGAWANDPLEGDASRGAQKAKQNDCLACHGGDGTNSNPERPRLAGHGERYVYNQLVNFATGARKHPFMTPQVFDLTRQDMRDLAAFVATLEVVPVSVAPADGRDERALLKEGERIYREGLPDQGVFACMICHGSAGEGVPVALIPRIGGQNVPYVLGELQAFRSGKRKTDWNGVMRFIAGHLSNGEMRAVASYASRLDPRGDGLSRW